MAQGAKPGEGGQLPGHKVYPVDREGAALDAGRDAAVAAAASRHLLDRRSGAAHLRSEEREPGGAHPREAGRGSGRRHDCGRRRQGARRRRADLRPRRRHRRVAADRASSTAASRGNWDWPRRSRCSMLNDLRDRIVVQVDGQIEDRPRRGHRGAARRRGIRLRHRAARGVRLHHDARLPSQYVSGRRRDAGPGAAKEVRGQTGIPRELLPVPRRGRARADGRTWVPHDRRNGRPCRSSRHEAGGRSLEGRGRRSFAACFSRRRSRPTPRGARRRTRITRWRPSWTAQIIAAARPAIERRERGGAAVPDSERESCDRNDARLRDHAAPRRRGSS